MKRILLSVLLLPSLAFAKEHSVSSESLYGRLDLGLDIRKEDSIGDIKVKNNKTCMSGIGAGYKFNQYLRSDLNLQYRDLETKDNSGGNAVKNGAITAMLNGYVDLPTGTMFTPYVSAGVGISSIRDGDIKIGVNQVKVKKSENFAWNTGFGVVTKFQDSISLDVGYNFVSVGKIKFKLTNGSIESKIQAHELTAGIIVSF